MSETTTNFDEFITTHDKPVLVDFWADWCQPCKIMGPILVSLVHEWSDRLTVIKVNTEEKPHLAARYSITGIPTMILFKKGIEVHRVSGAMPLGQLKNMLLQFINV